MSHTSTSRPSGSELPLGQSPSARPQPSRPGWPEVALGLAGLAVVALGLNAVLKGLGLDPVVYGLLLTALAGVSGIAGFALAVALRIRDLGAFGIRRVSGRWILVAVVAGVVAFGLKSLGILAWTQLFGAGDNVQTPYGVGGGGGVVFLVLATAFLTLLTPLGEELLFRGVITSALLRYGPIIGVLGSTLIFAVTHGFNTVFPAALVVGLITAELFRRSGSIWPAVIVHAVHNLPTVPALVLAAGG